MKIKKTGKRWGQQVANLTTAEFKEALETLKGQGFEISTGGGSKLPEGTFVTATITSLGFMGNDELKQSMVLAQIEYDYEGKRVKDSCTVSGEFDEIEVGDSIYIECRQTASGLLRNRQCSESQYEAGTENSEAPKVAKAKLTLADVPKNLSKAERKAFIEANDIEV